MYAGATRVAILSKETFTPSVTQTGFASIKAGLTLNSTLGAVFEGSTTEASAVDVSSTSNTSATVIAGGNFLRADAADTTTGALTVDNDTGVIIGDAQELTISVSSNDVTIAQTSLDKDLNNEDPMIEEVPVVEVKFKEKKRFKTMPNIAGVFTGKLQIDALCSAGGLSCNNGFTVYSYDIQYYNGYGDVIERVNDDKFPPFLCNKLRTYNLNQEIMITNILAKNEEGLVERLISMRIEPIF